jgi:hypothetical protein
MSLNLISYYNLIIAPSNQNPASALDYKEIKISSKEDLTKKNIISELF